MCKCISVGFIFILATVGIVYVVVYKNTKFSWNQNLELESTVGTDSIMGSTTVGYKNYDPDFVSETDSTTQESELEDGSGGCIMDSDCIDIDMDIEPDNRMQSTILPPIPTTISPPMQPTTPPILIGGSGDGSGDGPGDDTEDEDYTDEWYPRTTTPTTTTIEPADISEVNEPTRQTLVKVSLYYETMCPYCKNWIKNELCPVVEKLSEYFYIDFVPYGNAVTQYFRTRENIITCQHGAEECEGNRLQSCAVRSLSYLHSTKLICCMESESTFEPQGKRCLEELGIDIPSIVNCANGPDGQHYHFQDGMKTKDLSPPLTGVPWIIFNDKYQDNAEVHAARTDFISVLCKYIPDPKPAECTVKEGKEDDYDYLSNYNDEHDNDELMSA